MNKKLTIADIAVLLSIKSGITKKESEQFVKDFFALASEVISSGEALTIKGVGAFVPIWVDARTSVDVNTKQSIEIPGHYKLSFTPDKTMKDAVNAPFAAFTTEIIDVEIPEKTVRDVEQVNIKDEIENSQTILLEDEELSLIEKDDYTDEEEVKNDVEQISEAEVSNIEEINDLNEADDAAADLEEEKGGQDESKSEVEILSTVYNVDDIKIQKEYRRRTRNGYIFGFLTAFILFAIFISLWFFFFKDGKGLSISFSSFKFSTIGEQVKVQDSLSVTTFDIENKEDSMVVESNELMVSEKEQVENETELADLETVKKEPVVETIERGKFLTTIAQKYYGDKVFWVYIYRENSGRIWNPRDLKAGFEVVVPDAEKYNIDASNPESIKRAKELEKQILYEIE